MIRSAPDVLAIFRARQAELGMSNSALEDAAKLGDGNASKILKGKRDMRASTQARLCRVLKLEQIFVPITAETSHATLAKARNSATLRATDGGEQCLKSDK